MRIDKQKALSELGITEDFYNELIQDFIAQAVPAVKNLDGALERENFDELAGIAHFIKGSAGNLRIEEIYLIAKDLEFCCKERKDKQVIEQGARGLKSAMEEFKKMFSSDNIDK